MLYAADIAGVPLVKMLAKEDGVGLCGTCTTCVERFVDARRRVGRLGAAAGTSSTGSTFLNTLT